MSGEGVAKNVRYCFPGIWKWYLTLNEISSYATSVYAVGSGASPLPPSSGLSGLLPPSLLVPVVF